MTTDPVHTEAVRRKVEDLCHEIGRLKSENNRLRAEVEHLGGDDLSRFVAEFSQSPEFQQHYLAAHLAAEVEQERDKLKGELRLTDGDLYVAVQEVRRLREAVKSLHRPCTEVAGCQDGQTNWCHECEHPYPCRTFRALDGAE